MDPMTMMALLSMLQGETQVTPAPEPIQPQTGGLLGTGETQMPVMPKRSPEGGLDAAITTPASEKAAEPSNVGLLGDPNQTMRILMGLLGGA